MSMTRLQGLWRLSSCSRMSSSQAVRQAPEEPGRQKMKVALATPATARDCRLEVRICWKEMARNSSPNPSISLSSRGETASGVPSRPVIPCHRW
jgi:hypothetical protein